MAPLALEKDGLERPDSAYNLLQCNGLARPKIAKELANKIARSGIKIW
jgi:hypothetical protein